MWQRRARTLVILLCMASALVVSIFLVTSFTRWPPDYLELGRCPLSYSDVPDAHSCGVGWHVNWLDFGEEANHNLCLSVYRGTLSTRWATRETSSPGRLIRPDNRDTRFLGIRVMSWRGVAPFGSGVKPFVAGACSLPLWLVDVALLAYPGYVLVRGLVRRRGRRGGEGQCGRCGYDLTGNVTGVCSECGVAIDPE